MLILYKFGIKMILILYYFDTPLSIFHKNAFFLNIFNQK